jgi:RHS repeat-associated protein
MHLSLAHLCFATLIALATAAATDGPNVPPANPPPDGIADYPRVACYNGGYKVCRECIDGKWVFVCSRSSLISNENFGYLHDAHDYRIATDGAGGCAPCGSATAGLPANGLQHLAITRYHRSRPGGFGGSFGTNVYAPWDLQTSLEWSLNPTTGLPGPVTVRLFDPANLSIKLAFADTARFDPAGDGVLRDPAGIYRQILLLDAAGQPTPLGASATQVRLVAHDGMTWTFEVVKVNNSVTSRQGRLTGQTDRHGQVQQTVTYRFPASTSLADLGNDRQRLWQVATVADAYGRSAAITYDDTTKRGSRYAISRIDLPNGAALAYGYNGSNLATVAHPGGEVSRFDVGYDQAQQKTRWVIDDPAAESGHQRKTVWFTGSSWTDRATGTVYGQTIGLTARVDNAAGEVAYYNQPSAAPNTMYVFSAAQGYFRLHASNGVSISEVARASANGFVADPATLAWEPALGFTYSGTELLSSASDALGRTTTYTTSQQTRQVTRTVHPDGTVSTATYNAFSQPLVETDRLGRVTTSTYDAQGNRLTQSVGTGAELSQTQWTWNARGQMTSETDPRGNRTEYEYDALGQLVAIVEPADEAGGPRARRTFTYDACGRLERSVDAGGRAVRFTYDDRNRVVRRTYADQSWERIDYAAGLIQAEIDRNGVETRYGYDAAGRRVSTTVAFGRPEAATETCSYVYGSATLKAACVQAGERTEFGYDSRYRLVSTTRYPRAGVPLSETRSYDLLDRLASTTDAYGRRTDYVYDTDDRLVRQVRELLPGSVPAADQALAAFEAERGAARGTWQLAGYGGLTALGSASVSGDSLTLTATAYGSNGISDKGALYSRQLVGDGSVTVRLDEVPTQAAAMYGIMLRAGLGGTAPMFSVYVNPQTGMVSMRYRVAAGQGTVYVNLSSYTGPPLALPRWLRLERTGTFLRAGISRDGVAWTWCSAVAAQLPETVEAGSFLNVTSGATWPVVVRSTVPVIAEAGWQGPSASAMRSAYLTRYLAALPRLPGANPPYVIADSAYDAAGQVVARIDGRGVRTTYAYDSQGRLSAQTEAADTLPATTAYGYDAAGNRITVTGPSPRGVVTAMTYTGRNLLASVTEASGTAEATTVRRLTYSPTRKVASETDALYRTTIYQYGTCCDRLVRILDAAGFATSFAYDFVGNRVSVTDGNELTTLTYYDGRRRVDVVRNPALERVRMAYDDDLTDGVGLDAVPAVAAVLPGLGLGLGADGSAIASTDALEFATYELRDGLGRPVARIDALGHATTVRYDAMVGGLVETAQTDAVGHVTRVRSDGAGLARQQVDALGFPAMSGFDAVGNQLSQRDALGLGWDAIYDARNRLLARTTTRQDQVASTSWAYDADGNRIEETDALGKTEFYRYDLRNRRTHVTDRLGGITRFGYDAVGNLIAISDADNEAASPTADKTTQYAYDARNLLVAEAFPTGLQGRTLRVYGYDAGRQLTSRQVGILAGAFSASPAFAGAVTTTTYAYDAASRLTTRGYDDGAADGFLYDAAGRLIRAASARYATTVGRQYDAAGRLTSESLSLPDGQLVGATLAPATYTVGYAYLADSTLASQTYPTGSVVSRTYTNRHELATVGWNGSAVAARTYDAAGRLTQATAGNGLVETRSHLAGDHLVASIAVPGVTGFAYTYDAAGRKLTEATPFAAGGGQTFGYDAAGRLTDWQAGASTQSWNLSLVGDWRSTTRDGVVEPRVNTAVHEAIQVGPNILTYDQQGNLTRDEHQTALAWDPENRLTRARVNRDASQSGLGSLAAYRYDALGRRIAKTVDGTTTLYLPAGAQTVVELDRPALPLTQAAIDGAEADGTLASMSQTPASGGILPGAVTRINFQPATTVVPAGFVKDAGRAQAVRTNTLTYGWSDDATDQAVVRHGAVSLVEYDTHIRLEAGQQWRVALPNGTYPVVVVAGDPLSTLQTNHLLLNGQRLSDPDPSSPPGYAAGDFDGWAVLATVTDGYLTINGDSDAADAKLCFVEIGVAGAALPDGIVATLEDLIDRVTNQTGANPEPVGQVREFVYGSYVDEVLAYTIGQGAQKQTFYPHYNHLYSVAALTNAAGQVVERFTYDAYGKQKITSPTGAVRAKSAVGFDRGFTGYITDNETGLLFARARMYSPTLGRFVSRDPQSQYVYSGPFISDLLTRSKPAIRCEVSLVGRKKVRMCVSIPASPTSMDGYRDGMSLYSGYFVPNRLDPSGMETYVQCYNRVYNACRTRMGGGGPPLPDADDERTCQQEARDTCQQEDADGNLDPDAPGDGDIKDCPCPHDQCSGSAVSAGQLLACKTAASVAFHRCAITYAGKPKCISACETAWAKAEQACQTGGGSFPWKACK